MSVKDIRTRDHQRVQDFQDQGYNVEIIWEKDWQALPTQRPEIKDYLAQHRTYMFKMVTCLRLSNVTLKFQIILKNIFPKWRLYIQKYWRLYRWHRRIHAELC